MAQLTKRVKMYHFTCSTCRKKDVNTLFCTLMDPEVVTSCICPHFVDLDKEYCAGPDTVGMFHISYELDNVNVAMEEDRLQFMLFTREEPVGRLGTEGQLAYVHKVSCATCETIIGYEYVRMVGGNGQMKFTIVGNRLQKDDINSQNPAPRYLLSEGNVTKFLTKRK